MGLFKWKKKKEEESTQKPIAYEAPPCKHKWKDFDWYLKWAYYPIYSMGGIRQDYGRLEINIYEPYVCIWCKEREDKLLRNISFDKIDEKEAKKRYDEYKNNPKIRPREEIEDEIEDMKHNIDRDYIALVEKLYPYRLGAKETKDL